MPQVKNRFYWLDGTRGEVWLAGDCELLVTHFTRPNAFTRFEGRDPFTILMDLGIEQKFQEAGLQVETPHGVGHNCFKMSAESLPKFLDVIESFVDSCHSELLKRVRCDSRATDWSKSWWRGDLPDDTQVA